MTTLSRLGIIGTYAAVVLLAGCTAMEYINNLSKKQKTPVKPQKQMVIPIADGRKLVYHGNTIKMIPAHKEETLDERVSKEESEQVEKPQTVRKPAAEPRKVIPKTPEIAFLNVYNDIINRHVAEANEKYDLKNKLDPDLIKAFIMTETGSKIDRKTAFRYDPMQIANSTGFALKVLRAGKENTQLLTSHEFRKKLKSKKVVPIVHTRRGRKPDYWKTNMDPDTSIEAGIAWILHKAAIYKTGKTEYGKKIEYTVRKGDTVSEIAQKCGTTTNAILRYNGLSKKSRIKPGQKLKFRKTTRKKYIAGWKPFIEAIRGYNKDKDYVDKVLRNYQKIKFNGMPEKYEGTDRVHLTSGGHIGGPNICIDKVLVHITDSEGDSGEKWFNRHDIPKKYQVSAHYIVEKDGTIVQIVPEDIVAYHCREYNNGSIGIEFVGKLDDTNKQTFTDAQIREGKNLIQYLQGKYGLSNEDVFGHRDFTNKKECPGVANLKAMKDALNTQNLCTKPDNNKFS